MIMAVATRGDIIDHRSSQSKADSDDDLFGGQRCLLSCRKGPQPIVAFIVVADIPQASDVAIVRIC